jgi:phytoene dehydrogenase-like protein
MSTANRYDAIVIGGGHNGLITAAYLATHGARTLLLELRHKTGGAADDPEGPPRVEMTR